MSSAWRAAWKFELSPENDAFRIPIDGMKLSCGLCSHQSLPCFGEFTQSNRRKHGNYE